MTWLVVPGESDQERAGCGDERLGRGDLRVLAGRLPDLRRGARGWVDVGALCGAWLAKAGIQGAASPTRADCQKVVPPDDGSRLSPGKTIIGMKVYDYPDCN